MAQVPSIGRIVMYQRHGSPNGQHKSEPSPAIITKVEQPGERVSLCIINPTGLFFTADVPYDEGGGPGTWRWPAYVPPKKD